MILSIPSIYSHSNFHIFFTELLQPHIRTPSWIHVRLIMERAIVSNLITLFPFLFLVSLRFSVLLFPISGRALCNQCDYHHTPCCSHLEVRTSSFRPETLVSNGKTHHRYNCNQIMNTAISSIHGYDCIRNFRLDR